jgi:ABC-type Fe3+-citrate transport system substrate-binding protein
MHDLVSKDEKAVMKDEKTYKKGIMHQLGLQNAEKASKYSLWEQLCREIIIHMRSREFREEFL